MRTTVVVGVSGVGKSRLIGELATSIQLRHVQASELLRKSESEVLKRAVDAEELRTGRVIDNQLALITAFLALRASETRHILFDGHNVIDTDHGLVDIPFDVFSAIGPALIIAIVGQPAEILLRRSLDLARKRPQRSVDDIECYQDRVVELARAHADLLGIPMAEVQSGDIAHLKAVAVQEHE